MKRAQGGQAPPGGPPRGREPQTDGGEPGKARHAPFRQLFTSTLGLAMAGLLVGLVRKLVSPPPPRPEPLSEPSGKQKEPFHAHEDSDVNIKAIAGVAAFLIALAFTIHLAVYWMYAVHDRERPAPPQAPKPPDPRLQIASYEDLAAYLGEERAILDSYGWSDRAHGLVRVPIHRAMALLVREGLPTLARPATFSTLPLLGPVGPASRAVPVQHPQVGDYPPGNAEGVYP